MINPKTDTAAYCPVCAFVIFTKKDALGQPIFNKHNLFGKCRHCNTSMVGIPVDFEEIYLNEGLVANRINVAQKYALTNPQYDAEVHKKRYELELLNGELGALDYGSEVELEKYFGITAKELREKHNIDECGRYISSVIEKPNSGDKIAYCPKCGRLYTFYYLKDGTIEEIRHECECARNFFRPKLRKECQLVKTEETIDIYRTGSGKWAKKIGEPETLDGITPSIYQYFWENYVLISSNVKFDKVLHEEFKEEMRQYFEKGGYKMYSWGTSSSNVKCPKCKSSSITTQKDFNTGKAVAGAMIAGVAGAIIGGAGGNKVINVCQKCGYKWEPGK